VEGREDGNRILETRLRCFKARKEVSFLEIG
jgi:hypothetical protein